MADEYTNNQPYNYRFACHYMIWAGPGAFEQKTPNYESISMD
jgi:hypothetical protein